ncbi:MAG TPA: hypothetical protein VFS39_19365 [Nitrospira sp.]|nr:hypothetical protein [Nitrospira sp.]
MSETVVGGLNTRILSGSNGSRNAPAVILLHGFGAPGDDLLPLASAVAAPPGVRFIVPEGPLALTMGYRESRAWWLIDLARLEADRAAGRLRDLSREVPRGLPAARAALERFLAELPQVVPIDYEKTIIGGFSQGAMLSCDIVMRTALPIAGLVQLSGTLFARQDWRLPAPARSGLPVFQSHGTQDPLLPFVMAEQLRDELTRAGLAVDWHSFRGGHEIPQGIVEKLGLFVTRVLKQT